MTPPLTPNKQPLQPDDTVIMHPKMPAILFHHRMQLSFLFHDVLGHHGIRHVSIDLIDPSNQWISFSSTPSMIYQLIHSNLWKLDSNFRPSFFKKHALFPWEHAYHDMHRKQLKQVKESEHGFSEGFTVVRRIYDFYFLYAFATEKNAHNWEPSDSKINQYLKIGDYCYRHLKKLYAPYCKPYAAPRIDKFIPFSPGAPKDIGRMVSNQALQLRISH